MTKCFSHL